MVGHALSWQNTRDLQFGPNKTVKSKLWTPNNFSVVKSLEASTSTTIVKPKAIATFNNNKNDISKFGGIIHENDDESDGDFSDEDENENNNYDDDDFNFGYGDSNEDFSEDNESNIYFKKNKSKNLNDISNFLNLKSTSGCLSVESSLLHEQQQQHQQQSQHEHNPSISQELQLQENRILGTNRNFYSSISTTDGAYMPYATSAYPAYDGDMNYDTNNNTIKLVSHEQSFAYSQPQQQQQQQQSQQQYGFNIANPLCNYTNLNCTDLFYANFNELTPPSSTSSSSSAFNYYNNEAKLLKSTSSTDPSSAYSYLNIGSMDSNLATFYVQTNEFNNNGATNQSYHHGRHHIDSRNQLLIDQNLNYYYTNN